MKCLMVKNELKAYIDGELGPITRLRVARHLARCVECSMEVEAMTDLTNQVKNAGAVPAPRGLRDRVLGKIHFEPVQTAASKWPFNTRPIAVVGVLVFAVVAAALVFPTFQSAKEQSVMVAERARRMSPSQTAKESRPANKVAKWVGAVPREVAADKKDGDLNLLWTITTAVPAPSPSVEQAGSVAKGTYSAPLMIIKSADISVLVRSYSQASDEAVAAARFAGGYVTDSSTNSEAGIPTSGTMTIRVPASSFEKVVEQLGKLGKVTSKSMGGQDVTGEYVDLDSQLRNKRAEERQYLEIMNRAKRVSDVMIVSEELYRVRGEIEEMTGRMKYLKSSAAMSTINLTLSEKEKPKPAPQGLIRQSFSDALGSLIGTLGKLAGMLIWLVVYSPFWALPVLGLLYWRRRAAVPSQPGC